jgi:signal transduction histidine kinase
MLDKVYHNGETLTHAEEDGSEPDPAYWLYAMWPTLDADERPVGVIIQLARVSTFCEDAAAINEALLVAGLRQHELTAAAEKFNEQLQTEIAGREKTEAELGKAVDSLMLAKGVAERSNKAKDDFLAALSHELRTPLTPVLITAAALREDERLPADIREQLGMMERNISIEARLIDDLLDLTKVSNGRLDFRRELCDAHQLVDFAIEIVRDEARAKGIVIERELIAFRHGLMADPARLQQVIWNLLRNAVKFTPVGGSVSIRTRDESTPAGENRLRIEVADSGIGIDSERLEQIFLPFDQGGLTSDHRFGGLGLGLTIARTVVDLHGGRISAQSAGTNCGTTFVVDLPGAVQWQETAVPDVTPSPSSGSAALDLLLVEDHESTRQALCRLLKRDGHHVVTASTVADALVAAATRHFDLVISDQALPDGIGTDLMKELRDTYGLRGIALSGYGMAEDIARSHEAGFITHLTKPVAIAELRRVIAELARQDLVLA